LKGLQKDYYILRILNLYRAHLMCGILTLHGPVKMEHFITLKNHIKLNNLKIKDIIVK